MSPRGRIYKSYGGFRISLSFSSGKLICLVFYSIDPRDFIYIDGDKNFVRRGRLVETLEALQQEVGILRRKIFPRSKKFIKAVNVMYSDLNSLWEKV